MKFQFVEDEEIEEKEDIKPAVVKPIPVIHRKPVVHKEALTEKEIKSYIDKQIREQIRKEEKIEIDPTKVFNKLRSLDPEEYPYYNVIIRRTQTGRRSYLDSYISFINRYYDEFKK